MNREIERILIFEKREEKMLQYPAFMLQYPWSTETIPTSFLLPAQWPHPQSDELLLAMEESDFEEKVCTLNLYLYFFFFTVFGCI